MKQKQQPKTLLEELQAMHDLVRTQREAIQQLSAKNMRLENKTNQLIKAEKARLRREERLSKQQNDGQE